MEIISRSLPGVRGVRFELELELVNILQAGLPKKSISDDPRFLHGICIKSNSDFAQLCITYALSVAMLRTTRSGAE